MVDAELFKDTCFYKDAVNQGKAEGKAEGRAEVELKGRRTALRLSVNRRFPALGLLPEIDGIDRAQTIDQLFLAVVDAKTEEDVRAVVQSALRLN